MEIDLKNAQELDPNKKYILQLDFHDTPIETVAQVVQQIHKKLVEEGIKQVIYLPVRNGNFTITIEHLDNSRLDKTLRQYLEEKIKENE